MNGDPPVVLIVEDEPAIRRLLRAMLEANDYRALDAATAADAEWTLRHIRFFLFFFLFTLWFRI